MIAIPIETKSREFLGKLWLSVYLSNNEYSCAIGPSFEIKQLLDIIEPDVYVTKDPGDNKETFKFFDELRGEGVSIVGLDPEGAIYNDIENLSYNKKEVLHHLDYLMSWGKVPAREVKKHYDGKEKGKVIVTGNPRFDLVHKGLKKIYKEGAKKIRSEIGNFFLFNCNFTLANPFSESQIDKRESVYGTIKDEEKNHNKESFESFIDAIDKVSDKNRKKKYVVRPHPSESKKYYFEKFGERENVLIRWNGDVRKWILASKGVVHYDCTTGIESALLKKPTISYRKVKNKKYESRMPQIVSKEVDDLNSLEESLNKLDEKSSYKIGNKSKKKLRKFIKNISCMSVKNIKNVVENCSNSSPYRKKASKKQKMKRLIEGTKASGLIKSISDNIMSMYYSENYKDKRKYRRGKFDSLSRREVLKYSRELSGISGMEEPLIEKVPKSQNSFYIK